jgi:hypothetical protein
MRSNSRGKLDTIWKQPHSNCFLFTYTATQVEYDDDQEQDSSALTIAAERRRLQLNTSAVFTTAGPQNSRTGPQAAGSSSGPRVGASGRSKGRVTAAAAAAGLFNTASGGAGVGGGSVFAPAGTRGILFRC